MPRDGIKEAALIVACDGVWDVITNEDAVALVRGVFHRQDAEPGMYATAAAAACRFTHVLTAAVCRAPRAGYEAVARDDDVDAAEELVFEAVDRGSGDNITAVVARLSPSVAPAQARDGPLRVAPAI